MSEKKADSYKLKKRIKDDTLNVDLLSEYNLSLQINPNLFRVCVTDYKRSRCLLLEDYEIASSYNADNVLEKLVEIYDNHHVLKAGYWRSIKLAFKTPNFSLIPNSLFEEQYAKEYLHLNCNLKVNNSEEVFFYKQNSIDVINIFSADKKVIEWFQKSYPGKNIQLIHHTSSLIEAVLLSRQQNDESTVFLCVEKDNLTILVTKSKNLELCNTYNFTTPEDFIYYVIFVMDQLKLDPNKNKVTIWGDILPDSDIYKIMYKYIRNLNFGEKPSSLYFGYNFDELFDHSFFDLYTMHFCE